MLGNLKSSFFIRNLFSKLKDNKKLELIKYNKNLQNTVNVNLIDYKTYKSKYIIYETKNKGKEYYYNGILVYEGEYLNCKRHGKGKEYGSINNLIFEGEYLNGKRHGKGKEFFDNKLIFEGEYKNGERNGKGKEFSSKGFIRFEGEYLNGLKWNGKEYNKDNNIIGEIKEGKGIQHEYHYSDKRYIREGEYLIYEGEYLNGLRHGKGKEYTHDYGSKCKIVFDGEFKNGKRWTGKAYHGYQNNQFEIKDGKGFMIEEKEPIYRYEGEYLNGERNGKGKEYEYMTGRLMYEGDYLNNKRNGIGKEYHNNNKILFEGEYLNNERNGKGKEYNYNGELIFEGEYLNGKKNGKGKEYNCKGELIFEGEYLYNWRRRGKEYIKNKLEYEGEYLFNKKWTGNGYDENGNIIYKLINGTGKGKEYNDNHKLIFEGEYLNGKRNGKGKNIIHGMVN